MSLLFRIIRRSDHMNVHFVLVDYFNKLFPNKRIKPFYITVNIFF